MNVLIWLLKFAHFHFHFLVSITTHREYKHHNIWNQPFRRARRAAEHISCELNGLWCMPGCIWLQTLLLTDDHAGKNNGQKEKKEKQQQGLIL